MMVSSRSLKLEIIVFEGKLKRMFTTSYESPRVGQLSLDASRVRVLTPEKRRKITHADRKEKLEEKICLLESGVAVLKTRHLAPPVALQKDPILRPAAAEYAKMVHAMHAQQLQVAKMQSAMSRCLSDDHYNPLYTRICLTSDWAERRATLLALRSEKIRSALEFVMTPVRFGDPLKQKFSETQFENEQGDLCCVRFDTIQFPGVKSLQQVYDALSFYKNNMEIIISEQLGHITVRDDYDAVADEAYNTRILSTSENGITTEGNVISFRAIVGEKDERYIGEPCVVLVADTVDEDERYPYLSDTRVRKDISKAVVLTAIKRRSDASMTGQGGDFDDVVVTMRRAAFYTVHRPDFPLSVCQFEELREAMTQWSDVMLKTMRGILYPSRA